MFWTARSKYSQIGSLMYDLCFDQLYECNFIVIGIVIYYDLFIFIFSLAYITNPITYIYLSYGLSDYKLIHRQTIIHIDNQYTLISLLGLLPRLRMSDVNIIVALLSDVVLLDVNDDDPVPQIKLFERKIVFFTVTKLQITHTPTF